ncbi:MAG: aldo/keto reductase [Rubripirellula sp.]
MQFHTFPDTDLVVSRLCFGCWGIIGDLMWGDRSEDDSKQAMRAAIDAGVNFFDTAPMYGDGQSEILLGRFLTDHGGRDETVIATKIRPSQMRPEQVRQECEESLQRLQTDYIDLYQTHWTDRDVPLAETWGAMRELQQQGKVRQIGVCNMGVGDLAEVVPAQKPLTNQLPYNLLSRMIEFEIQPYCVKSDIGILVYSSLLHGILADKYRYASEVPEGKARTRHFSKSRRHTRHDEEGCESEMFDTLSQIREIASGMQLTMAEVALKWLMHQAGVASVIAGAGNAEQLNSNVRFLAQELPESTLLELNEATSAVKTYLGSNADLWDPGENGRFR